VTEPVVGQDVICGGGPCRILAVAGLGGAGWACLAGAAAPHLTSNMQRYTFRQCVAAR
jgi:hypothetical protein